MSLRNFNITVFIRIEETFFFIYIYIKENKKSFEGASAQRKLISINVLNTMRTYLNKRQIKVSIHCSFLGNFFGKYIIVSNSYRINIRF